MPDALLAKLRQLGRCDAPPRCAARVLERCSIGDRYVRIQTPLGKMFVAYSKVGITAVSKASSVRDFQAEYRRYRGRPVRQADRAPKAMLVAIARRLAGDPKAPALAFDLQAMSEFEQAVLRKAIEIPHGQIRPYTWIAHEIGNPKAVRAVGSALGANPVPLLIPCHRVVRSDGHIGEYGLGGPKNKRRILAHEGVDPDEIESYAAKGYRFVANDRAKAVCYPTCYGKEQRRRFSEQPHIHFYKSIRAAVAAGYKPCESCRPKVA